MKKIELIRELKKAHNTEESIISVAGERVKALVLRSGAPKENILKVRTLMQRIIDESKEHRKIIESLIERVEGEERDDY